MDIFESIRSLDSVERISNLSPHHPQPLNFLFFLCPSLSGKGYYVNKLGTGITARYVNKVSKSAIERVSRVNAFVAELRQKIPIPFVVKAVFSSADALMLCVPPVPVPQATASEEIGFPVIANDGPVLRHLCLHSELYNRQCWQSVPDKIWKAEYDRLMSFLPVNTPDNIRTDFAHRVFAGFGLDGLLMRDGCFGENPIILGVESPGVTKLQNAALLREEWLPVVQLK